MSRARYTVEPNGCGGWETHDNKENRVVTHSAFREFCVKAVDRLTLDTNEGKAYWRAYYGVKS